MAADQMLSNIDYRVAVVLEVRNDSQYDLGDPKLSLDAGDIIEVPKEVKSGIVERFSARKRSDTACGK